MANGQQVVNSFHIVKGGSTGVPDLATMQRLADDLEAYLGASYRGVGTTDYTMDQWLVRNVDHGSPKTAPGEVAHVVNQPGTRTITGGHIPTGLCAVLSLKTVFASRRARGHMFMPPAQLATALNADNIESTSAYWTALVAYGAKLDDGVANPTPTWTGSELSNWALVVYSAATATETAGAQIAYNVRSVVVKPKASFLRSRERGGS